MKNVIVLFAELFWKCLDQKNCFKTQVDDKDTTNFQENRVSSRLATWHVSYNILYNKVANSRVSMRSNSGNLQRNVKYTFYNLEVFALEDDIHNYLSTVMFRVTHCIQKVSQKTQEFSDELDVVFVMNQHCKFQTP